MADREKKPNKIAIWWRETVGELHKVSWPTSQEAWRLTRIVIIVIILVGIFLGLVDYALSKLVTLVVG
jgi:preprotein translocase subunit SecE